MGGLGKKGEVTMYHEIPDKNFLSNMKELCFRMMNELKMSIYNNTPLEVKMNLVGSGAKNLFLQNAKEPIDLDFNVNIIGWEESVNIGKNAREIKECIRKEFNRVLKKFGLDDCQDSTSALTTNLIHFTKGNKTEFSIDLAIVYEDDYGRWNRLIHEKTGSVAYDRWYWNEIPNSNDLIKKVDKIKKHNLWTKVMPIYKEKKNMYLKNNDYTHPSFIVYIETINQIYDNYHSKGII